jgi:hypothetical protein
MANSLEVRNERDVLAGALSLAYAQDQMAQQRGLAPEMSVAEDMTSLETTMSKRQPEPEQPSIAEMIQEFP